MKPTLLLMCVILFFTMSCGEKKVLLPKKDAGECFEVSVAGIFCGHAVLEIKDPNFYHLGEITKTFQHSFLATLACAGLTANGNIQPGKTFVKISTNPFPDDTHECMRCAGMPFYDGEKNYYVKFVNQCEPSKVTD